MLVVDNTSPFVEDILSCLDKLGVSFEHKAFAGVSDDDLTSCNKVILSGRREHSSEINKVNSRIIRHCIGNGKPLLGICYGAEIIALTLGGSISKMPSHCRGMTIASVLIPNRLTDKKKSMLVFESHRYKIARLPDNLKPIASSKYCEVEIFSNDSKIFGTQFHPEKSGIDGLVVLKNFSDV
ncbi:MAG TPA: gamma-glutamyl-gamma-aminobutyrate hydrolase family protein [Nitrososphaera sp.]